MTDSTTIPDNAAPTVIEPETLLPHEPTQSNAESRSEAHKKTHRLLVRVMLNVHGNDFLDQGKKELDVIDLKDTSSYGPIYNDIFSYFQHSVGGEKVDFHDGCSLTHIEVLWDGQNTNGDARTRLYADNCKDVLKMVELRKGRDVLLAMYRDEFDPEI